MRRPIRTFRGSGDTLRGGAPGAHWRDEKESENVRPARAQCVNNCKNYD